jgi:hypothetical protein
MSGFLITPDNKDGGKDEKIAWTIVYAIFALVSAFVFYYVFQNGVKFLEIVGSVLWIGGLLWMAGLGKKFYRKNEWTNVAIAIAAVTLGAILIWAA